MAEASSFGWALRKNGSCLEQEVDCGPTVAPFRNCCPKGSYCPHANNVACCPSEEFCDDALNAKPHCANSTWDLYINGGYFCCLQGTTGFAKDGGSNGCGAPDYHLKSTETSLAIIASASATHSTSSTPTSVATTTAPSITSTATDPSQPTNAASSSANKGAIAGGVVGGVSGVAIIAALLWFFLIRSRRQRSQPQPLIMAEEPFKQPPIPAELDGNHVAELESRADQPVAELPAHYR